MILVASVLLVACQPVPPADFRPVAASPSSAGVKPLPDIKTLMIPADQLTDDQIEAERWSAIYVCFRCHDMSERVISQQPRRRQKKHRKAMKKKRSCLDCHNQTDVTCCHDNIFPPIDRWE